MAKKKLEELTEEELAAQQASELPDRDAMQLVPIPGDDLGGPVHALPFEPPHETLPVEPPDET